MEIMKRKRIYGEGMKREDRRRCGGKKDYFFEKDKIQLGPTV
jgi:hypothetical protein